MMLLVSLGYLLIKFYGIIKWNKEAKKEKMLTNNKNEVYYYGGNGIRSKSIEYKWERI